MNLHWILSRKHAKSTLTLLFEPHGIFNHPQANCGKGTWTLLIACFLVDLETVDGEGWFDLKGSCTIKGFVRNGNWWTDPNSTRRYLTHEICLKTRCLARLGVIRLDYHSTTQSWHFFIIVVKSRFFSIPVWTFRKRDNMFYRCLRGNDKIRSVETGPKLASMLHSACLHLWNVFKAVFIFYRCKLNVCDLGGKQIRLEAAV